MSSPPRRRRRCRYGTARRALRTTTILTPPTETEQRRRIVRALADGGCFAPDAEADALLRASSEGIGPIDELIVRRLRGEPLAWITGSVTFCGVSIRVEPGVFVPRPHPRADVVATEIDPVAAACASRNGVRALVGDLDDPLPPSMRGRVDVMTAVVPYVPTEELHLLPRDVLANEPRRALDGGPRGTTVLVQAAEAAGRWLRPGGTVLLEIGGEQAGELARTLADAGLSEIRVHRDGDGHDRAIEARRPD
ncbi:MAG: peptide chain release factor N(5)-glutamine methyltransferase [Actinobacteria bacterium]|nr:MAG: peptide chain release factor N(5)-glutamine methyltransferase [Actinomycetota bacterium]